MKFSVLILALFSSTILAAQKPSVELLTSDTKTSIRGLSVVNDNVVWVSGSAGMVGRSTNGGKNWKWVQVKGFEKTEFRDIEAFNASTAVIMGIAEP
ncbi:MAG TPA: oxidoreductase, partial [Chitinophagaceae bacterium]|nr:oxidoreductase [Chitinophagaceae bacterium]